MYGIMVVVALAVFGVGVFLAVQEGTRRDWSMLAAGCVSLVLVLTTWPLAMSIAAARDSHIAKVEDLNARLTDRLQELSIALGDIKDNVMLSDRAKSVAYRDKDRDALRRAIREDIAKRDWEAALALADDMERIFGYRQEAMRFREEIHRQQEDIARRAINDGMAVIDRHCRAEAWSDALREAERLMAAFRGDPTVANLPQEIENRRQGHKKQLLDSWNDALNRRDIDGAIEILKRLDMYLTRAEAETMQDTVRNVFKEKLNNLKTQFTLAVQDHKWAEAVRVGETIVRDFPNSGIAREVKDKLDYLRQRAGEEHPAPASV